MKKKITIIIERAPDNYGAYAEKNIFGAWGSGDTIAEAKRSVVKTIKLLKKYNKKENVPKILYDDYELVYRLDVPSLLAHYKGVFTNAAMEQITGISQREIKQYASG